MAGAEGSFLGLAKQTAKGTPNTTDADFKYLLFRDGALGVNNMAIPLDNEVGGGALLRSVVKVGVNSGGAMDIIPRPETLGHFLYGVTGSVTTTADANLNGIVGPVPLTAGAQTGYNTKLHQPDTASTLFIAGTEDDMAGTVTIYGIVAGSADSDAIVLPGGGYTAGTKIAGAKTFTYVTSIDFPAETNPGDKVNVGYDNGYYTHVFKLPTDQFAAPYYTFRMAVPKEDGNTWGEQFTDGRINALAMAWRGARFMEGSVGFLGGEPTPVSTASWGALAKVDTGPQFLSPYGEIELPTGTTARVLEGSFAAQSAIPLDQQYIVGQFFPEGLDIVNRGFILNLAVKVTDDVFYKKVMYNPYGVNTWMADVFREGDLRVYFRSDVGQYSLLIQANGASGANANVFWSATPIRLQAGRQVLLSLTGVFAAAPTGDPIVLSLVNKRTSY